MSTLKAGTLYFALAFAAGWVFGPIRELLVIPRLGRTAGYLLEAPPMLVVIIVVARWTVRRLAISPALKNRGAVGLVALGLLLAAEVAGTRLLRGLSIMEWLASFRSLPGFLSLVMFLVFAVMPMLVARSPSDT